MSTMQAMRPSILHSIAASHARMSNATNVRTDVRTNGRICIPPTVSILQLRNAHARTQGYDTTRSATAAITPPNRLIHRPTLRVHPCKTGQDGRVWRDVRQGDPPNRDYLAAKQQLQERSEGEPA